MVVAMEVAIIVIVVFVVLLLVVIALVRLCSKFNFLGCCDNDSDTESIQDAGEGHDSDTTGTMTETGMETSLDEDDEDNDLQEVFGDDEEELHDGSFGILRTDQMTVEVDGEEYVVNKMEESLL